MKWSKWIAFPDPRKFQFINAPLGPGVYQLKNRATNELVLFGRGGHCAHRMTSILPKPLGCGRRNNSAKCEYVLANLDDIEYRCFPCASKADAVILERKVKGVGPYLFPH
jgi:hypothetical protein